MRAMRCPTPTQPSRGPSWRTWTSESLPSSHVEGRCESCYLTQPHWSCCSSPLLRLQMLLPAMLSAEATSAQCKPSSLRGPSHSLAGDADGPPLPQHCPPEPGCRDSVRCSGASCWQTCRTHSTHAATGRCRDSDTEGLDATRHFSYYAFAGDTGRLRWQHQVSCSQSRATSVACVFRNSIAGHSGPPCSSSSRWAAGWHITMWYPAETVFVEDAGQLQWQH